MTLSLLRFKSALVLVALTTLSACGSGGGGGGGSSPPALSTAGTVSGTITDNSGNPLAGVTVKLRKYNSVVTVKTAVTAANGSYSMNAAPGNYYVAAHNSTSAAFATRIYDGNPNGASNGLSASRITLTSGANVTANLALIPGFKVSGTVTDPTTGAAADVPFFIFDSNYAYVESGRTAIDGSYSIYLTPGSYSVWVRGQNATVNLSASDQTQNFSAAVSTITATIRDASNNPVANVKAGLYNTTATTGLQAVDVSAGDGTITLYGVPTVDSFLVLWSEDNAAISSSVYLNQTRILQGSVVTAPAAGTNLALGNISLSPGAILTGTVQVGGVAKSNAMIQIRMVTTSAIDRFILTRTQGDGTYSISMPAGATLARVCAFHTAVSCPPDNSQGTISAGVWQLQDSVVMGAAGTTTTVNFSY